MTTAASLARVHEITANREARKRRTYTAPARWWEEPLIGSILAVMVWLIFVGC